MANSDPLLDELRRQRDAYRRTGCSSSETIQTDRIIRRIEAADALERRLQVRVATCECYGSKDLPNANCDDCKDDEAALRQYEESRK